MSRDPIARGLEIEKAQLRGFARSVAEIEWLLLILAVLYLFIANPALARSIPVLGVLFGFAAFVLLFRYAKPLAKHTELKLVIESRSTSTSTSTSSRAARSAATPS